MEKEFTTYEQALAFKELDFNEPCFGYYIETGEWVPASYSKEGTIYPSNADLLPEWCTAPTFSQAFRWFRDRFKLHSYIEGAYPWFRYYINSEDDRYEGHKYLTYEEAESACLDELIKLVKNGR